ncbi:9243_t:CDS:1 [Ambispora gerdemannii]|uniref:9243_t:CDS:1 n=1 Tax=Ambispora gerdemannii TaxID=144530 RepID=A0A9N8YSC7_9GLOM|nr:9243_t:CDS:1 [Ambispora gerdemannii]
MTKIKNSISSTDKVRSAFTAEEDAHLREYIIKKKSEGAALHGNNIYRTYPALNNRHPWQSIRHHAIKFIIPQLPTNEVPSHKIQPKMYKNLLSRSEQETLQIYLLAQRNNHEGLHGYIIYQQYPALDEHSWETIREYAIKYIIPYLPEEPNIPQEIIDDFEVHVEIESTPENDVFDDKMAI